MNQNDKHKIRIRKFQCNDARKVSYLIRKTLMEVNSKDYPQDVIQFMYKNHSSKKIIDKSLNRLMYVAVDDDRIVGTVSLEDNTILTLYVNPRFHGKGIGTKLMMYVESVARQKGYQVVRLPSSITAYEFYKKLGYITIRKEYSEKYGQVIIMEKSL